MRSLPALRGLLHGQAPLLLLGLAPLTATAQDSTSSGTGLPGDAVDPHLLVEQENDFVVDLTAFRSSWGNVYGIAPLMKASAQYSPVPIFFTAQISAQSMSVDQRYGVPFPNDSYLYWSQPGAGVNDDATLNNTPATSIDTSLFVGNQFAVTFAEFASDDPTAPTESFNNVVSGVVNYEFDCPSRLYVTRVMAALNSPDWTCDLAQFGMGGIDSDGFTHIRGDAFGSGPCAGMTEAVGQNLYRVDVLGRNPAMRNVISMSGGTDATVQLVQDNTTCSTGFAFTHSPAVQIPSSVTGGLPICIGTTFSCPATYTTGQLVYGSSMPMSYTGAHLTGAGDGRGTVGYSKQTFPSIFGASATHGTGAVLGLGTGTDRLQIFGLASSGAPVGTISRVVPAVLTDNDDGWTSQTLGTGQLRFNNYFSQSAFRGGNGQVGIGKDQQGRLLTAAAADHPAGTGGDYPNNLIAVARTDNLGVTTWAIAAYVANASGKAVYDAGGTSVIGNLVTLATLTGGNPQGPSITSPMIDSVGNVYFVAPVVLNSGDDGIGLLRAVYKESDFSYRLELILLSGDVFHGQNSDRDYQVQFIPIADSNSIDSGAAFSSNINQDAHNGLDPSTLAVSSSETLGGVVVNASIVYDVNQDGMFETLTQNPATPDQQYNVMLLIGHAIDCNDNGVPDDIDIKNGTSQDTDGDGIPDECGAGAAFCFGDGSGTACPCGNESAPGAGQGCANSTGMGGQLGATGSASVNADDLTFVAQHLRPNQPGLLFAGNNAVNGGNGSLFGDGLRCAGQGVVRLGTRVPDANGTATWGPGLGAQGGWQAGDVRHFQGWYRDPGAGSPCGFGFNLTNGVTVNFVP